MNQTMIVDLYGASIADVEGTKYASLYVGQAVVDEKEEKAKGIIMMKLPCDPEVYDTLRAPKFPVQVELQTRLKKAAGGRMGQHCTAVTLRGGQAQPTPNKAASPAN